MTLRAGMIHLRTGVIVCSESITLLHHETGYLRADKVIGLVMAYPVCILAVAAKQPTAYTYI